MKKVQEYLHHFVRMFLRKHDLEQYSVRFNHYLSLLSGKKFFKKNFLAKKLFKFY